MLGSAILLAALVASPNSGVSISPAVVTAPSANSHATFVIGDPAKTPQTIRVQIVELAPVTGHPHEWLPWGEYDHYKVSDDGFTLNPGQHKSVTVTITAPDSYRHDLAIMAETQTTQNGQARVSARVAARYVIQGTPNPYAPKPVAQPQAPSHGLPPLVLILIPSLLLGILTALSVRFSRRRRARRTPA